MQFDPWLTPADSCMTFDPVIGTTLRSGVLPTKYGGHRTFLKQLDHWMTLDLWWGRFKNMLSNLVGPSPTPMPNIQLDTSKHDETHSRTYLQTWIMSKQLKFPLTGVNLNISVMKRLYMNKHFYLFNRITDLLYEQPRA